MLRAADVQQGVEDHLLGTVDFCGRIYEWLRRHKLGSQEGRFGEQIVAEQERLVAEVVDGKVGQPKKKYLLKVEVVHHELQVVEILFAVDVVGEGGDDGHEGFAS